KRCSSQQSTTAGSRVGQHGQGGETQWGGRRSPSSSSRTPTWNDTAVRDVHLHRAAARRQRGLHPARRPAAYRPPRRAYYGADAAC
ncbi:hypothetical protein ACRAWF_13725, partial [Streptomyces sp. L7]